MLQVQLQIRMKLTVLMLLLKIILLIILVTVVVIVIVIEIVIGGVNISTIYRWDDSLISFFTTIWMEGADCGKLLLSVGNHGNN